MGSRLRHRDSRDQVGEDATFQNKADTARPRNKSSRPLRSKWRLRNFPAQGGNGVTFATEIEPVKLFRPGRKRRDISKKGSDGVTFHTKAETAKNTKHFSVSDRGGYGDTFITNSETAQTSWPRYRQSKQEIFNGVLGPKSRQQLFRSGWRRRNFTDRDSVTKKNFLATFASEVDTGTFFKDQGSAQHFRPRPTRRD